SRINSRQYHISICAKRDQRDGDSFGKRLSFDVVQKSMSIVLPVGWTGFSGGGEVADYCGEPQVCDNPPCGPITPITYGLSLPQLSCAFGQDQHHLIITVSGGVPPYSWISTGGILTILDVFSAEITIHPDPTGAGDVGFFRPNLRYVATNQPGGSTCVGAEPITTQATADVRLGAYDCLGIHIITSEGGSDDNIPPWLASTSYAHPIGDAADATHRSVSMGITYGGTPTHAGVDPYPDAATVNNTWSVNTSRCTTGPTSGLTVSCAAQVAGQNGIHGTIWSGAPDYVSESKNLSIESIGVLDTGTQLGPLNYDGYIDVRTQTQIDTGCCVVPTGTSIVVTVTDTNEANAVIVIPVV
ncbi:MAG: hypothetical protein LUO93_05485, partial [Methanomicrobiales archaeon]|nr:hypothetical protein [Methanomicrobiales archaeon]